MTRNLTPSEVMAQLRAIEDGSVTIVAREDPAEVWAGPCEYDCSNGWLIVVSIDLDTWGYLAHAMAPDGSHWDWEDGVPSRGVDADGEDLPWLEPCTYCPPERVEIDIYGIPLLT